MRLPNASPVVRVTDNPVMMPTNAAGMLDTDAWPDVRISQNAPPVSTANTSELTPVNCTVRHEIRSHMPAILK